MRYADLMLKQVSNMSNLVRPEQKTTLSKFSQEYIKAMVKVADKIVIK